MLPGVFALMAVTVSMDPPNLDCKECPPNHPYHNPPTYCEAGKVAIRWYYVVHEEWFCALQGGCGVDECLICDRTFLDWNVPLCVDEEEALGGMPM